MDSKIELLQNWIDSSKRIVFFGGAGVSTESGVPDFRSKDGLYNQHDVNFEGYQPEYLLSHSCLVDEPKVFFEYYRQKMNVEGILPNPAHNYLVKLEQRGKLTGIVTQNIDGLHQKAGSEKVFEVHGSTLRNYCSHCGKKFGPTAIFKSTEPIPHCDCGGVIRPEVTLYEEELPENAVIQSIKAISEADMMIIGGTSLTVYPAAMYIKYFRGLHTVVINKEKLALELNPTTDLEINLPIGEVFGKLNTL